MKTEHVILHELPTKSDHADQAATDASSSSNAFTLGPAVFPFYLSDSRNIQQMIQSSFSALSLIGKIDVTEERWT